MFAGDPTKGHLIHLTEPQINLLLVLLTREYVTGQKEVVRLQKIVESPKWKLREPSLFDEEFSSTVTVSYLNAIQDIRNHLYAYDPKVNPGK